MKLIKHVSVLMLLFVCAVSAFSQRSVTPFNKGWKFVKTDVNVKKIAQNKQWKNITIPHTWNDKDAQSGKNYYAGVGCYQKNLFVKKSQKGKRFYLRFEGAGQVADVYVNGIHVGDHKGAYSAFCFEITDTLKYGQNNIIFVRVDNKVRPDIIPVNHNLFMVFGGIYRPVSLIITDKINITPTDYAAPGIYIRQEDVTAKRAIISVKSKLENRHFVKKGITLKTTVIDSNGKVVVTKRDTVSVIPTVVQTFNQKLTVANPILWNGRKNPYLYSLKVELEHKGKVVDSVTQPLGLRYFSMDPKKGFILNGKPYRLYGVCRHQEWEDHGSALSEEQHKIDFDLMYEMGCTSIRLAHYQQADYVYSYSNKLGFVIWAEIPFVNTSIGTEGANAKQQMLEMVRQNYNHPSIFMWGLHNEVYGKNSSSFCVRLNKELHNVAKSEDPDRWTVAVSGFGSMKRFMDLHADLHGSNRYWGWYYGKVDGMANWIKKAHATRPDNPLCVSEYGCGANVAHQKYNPKKPAPAGPYFPEQYQSTMHEIQWKAIYEHEFVWGSYLWNMFDFTVPGWDRGGIKGRNHKGLITYDRKTKKDAFFFYKANWSKEPVLHLVGRRLKMHGEATINIKTYSNLGKVQLKVNGKVIGTQTPNNVKVFLWENVKLKKGENLIEAKAGHLIDSFKLIYDPMMKQRAIDAKRKKMNPSFEMYKASAEDNGNVAFHAIDRDLKTTWSGAAPGSWLRLDLKKVQTLDSVQIFWSRGHARKYKFTISYSTDGNSWIKIFDGKSSGKAKGFEKFSFKPVNTKYIRIQGFGSDKSKWTNILEVKVK